MKKRKISILKLIFLFLLSGLCLSFPSCGDSDLEDDIKEDFKTSYIFYSYNPEDSESPSPITISYDIGKQVSASDLPSVSRPDFFALNPGYKIDGWVYLKNPLTGTTYIPSNFTYSSYTGENGSDYSLITGFLVTSAPASFYVHEWLPITYYIEFDGNGGSYIDSLTGSTVTKTGSYEFTYDTAKNLPENQFERNGYVFNGWNTSDHVGLTVKDFGDQSSVLNLANVDGKIITLYACWLKEKISISYDSNGGGGTMASQTNVSVGDSLSANTFTAPEGKYFFGWMENASGSGGYVFADSEILTEYNYPNSDTTLYAQWAWIPYTVIFDGNGGDGSMDSQNFEWGQAQALNANTFARTGYTFAGWNTSADGSGSGYNDGEAISIKADIRLYAQWQVESRTVNFDLKGGNVSGSTSLASQTVTFEDLPYTPAYTPQYEGYVFNGWSPALTTENWDVSDVTLVAQWKPKGAVSNVTKGLTLTYTANGIYVKAPDGGDSYLWMLDRSGQSESSDSYTILYSDYASDSLRHTLSVLVYDSEGIPAVYSLQFQIQ